MATPVNWTREEAFKLTSLWNKDVILQQLEGWWRNSLVYGKNIADDLGKFAIMQCLFASALQIIYNTFLALQLFL